MDALVPEVERLRAASQGESVPAQLHTLLAVKARALLGALGERTPVTREAWAAMGELEELLEEIDRLRQKRPQSFQVIKGGRGESER